jgi:hypothetical protein
MTDESSSPVAVELSLKRYAAILSHYTYESNAYWARSQVFLVAHAALFGFVLTNLPVGITQPSWARIYTLVGGTIFGLLLCGLWHSVLNAGSVWVDHWTNLLKKEAVIAFSSAPIWQIKVNEDYVSSRKISFGLCNLFIVVWSFTIVFLIVVAFAKWNGLILL